MKIQVQQTEQIYDYSLFTQNGCTCGLFTHKTMKNKRDFIKIKQKLADIRQKSKEDMQFDGNIKVHVRFSQK